MITLITGYGVKDVLGRLTFGDYHMDVDHGVLGVILSWVPNFACSLATLVWEVISLPKK